MTILTEGQHAGGFIISEASGTRSREEITVAAGQNLVAGQVLAKVGDNYVAYDNDATTGNTAVGILFAAVDATAGAAKGVAIVRDAEVAEQELEWGDDNDTSDIAAGIADLRALGIVLR